MTYLNIINLVFNYNIKYIPIERLVSRSVLTLDVHWYLLVDLFKKSSACIIAQIECQPKLVDNLTGIIILKYFYFLDVLPIQFYLEHTDWLLYGGQLCFQIGLLLIHFV